MIVTVLMFLLFTSKLFSNGGGVGYRDQAKTFLKESGKVS